MVGKPALIDFLEKQFGGSFNIIPNVITVGVAATKLVDHNFERMALLLMNIGSTQCFVDPESIVSTTRGIVLTPSGGFNSMNARDDLILPGWEWYGIVASGSTSVYVLEIVRIQAV